MDLLWSILLLVVVAIVAFAIARFLLHLTGKVIGCVVTAIVAIGIAIIIFLFIL
jgi:hypothetical protein